MRLIPASLRKLQALNWGQGLTATTYQRVQLRILCISMLMMLPVFPLLFGYMAYTRLSGNGLEALATMLIGAAILTGLVLLAMFLWLYWTMIKTSVMRWRGLGFKGASIVGMILLSFVVYIGVNVASEVGERSELLLTGMVPLWVYQWLGLAVILQIVQALLSYWLYFEETPVASHTAVVQDPYATAPGRFENAALFAQQVWVWFGILSVPMYFIVATFLNHQN
jgi:hypothetical protein